VPYFDKLIMSLVPFWTV